MEYFIDYSRPMTAEDFRAWRAHLRYDAKKAARALHVGIADVAALESGARPVDEIAQDCCRIAELVEHRRAERRRAARNAPPIDPGAEPPINPDGNDPRELLVPLRVEMDATMSGADVRAWRDHLGYTLHQAATALRVPVQDVVRLEADELATSVTLVHRCRMAEVWEWRKRARREYSDYWRRRGEPPPPPFTPDPSLDLMYVYRGMSAADFRAWQVRHGWDDEMAAVYLDRTPAQVRAYANGDQPIDALTLLVCWGADLPRPPRQRRPPWRTG